ncbi:MAG TPA: serpin family protein [Prevotellaceae bacterium]|nr:serpin family protein [Prevotellaceae bacterium]
MKNLISYACVALLLCSCTGNGVTKPVSLELAPQQVRLTTTCNDFSWSLLREVYNNEQESENVIVSPLSASMLLAMVMNGADGNTLVQMKQTLGFADDDINEINEYYKKLIEALPALDKTNIVKIANSIWAQEGYPFYDDFKQVNKDYFSAQIQNLDFGDASGAARTINKWASDNTNKLIKEVVDPNDLNGVRMLLANALYFKGVWANKFNKDNTATKEFTTSRGQKLTVERMQLTEEFSFADLGYATMLEMKYKEGKYCMDVLLPEANGTVESVLEQLNADQWKTAVASLMNYKVEVGLPKFKLGYNTDLTEVLKAMGITDAFAFDADFSKMSPNSLYLSQVKQYCQVNVDEEGTEAAAVTWGSMKEAAAPSESRQFIVDRPFLLVIREKQYGTILFLAAVGNVLAS